MSVPRISVSVPVDGVRDICNRMLSLEEVLNCIADAMDDGSSDRYLAVRMVAKEMGRLQCDLDVATWPSVEDESSAGQNS